MMPTAAMPAIANPTERLIGMFIRGAPSRRTRDLAFPVTRDRRVWPAAMKISRRRAPKYQGGRVYRVRLPLQPRRKYPDGTQRGASDCPRPTERLETRLR